MAYIILLGIIKLQDFFKLVVKFVGRGLNIYVDGVWFGYEITKNDEHIDNIETSKPYSKILKNIHSEFKSNKYYAGWFNPDPFGPGNRFKDLDKKKIVELYSDKEEMRTFVKNLISQEKIVSDNFIKELKKINLLS